MLDITEDGDAAFLPVKVVPGASRTRILGEWQGRLRVGVAAPPEKGRANEVLIDFLAELLGLARRDFRVAAGQTQPLKTIRIERISADLLRSTLMKSIRSR